MSSGTSIASPCLRELSRAQAVLMLLLTGMLADENGCYAHSMLVIITEDLIQASDIRLLLNLRAKQMMPALCAPIVAQHGRKECAARKRVTQCMLGYGMCKDLPAGLHDVRVRHQAALQTVLPALRIIAAAQQQSNNYTTGTSHRCRAPPVSLRGYPGNLE